MNRGSNDFRKEDNLVCIFDCCNDTSIFNDGCASRGNKNQSTRQDTRAYFRKARTQEVLKNLKDLIEQEEDLTRQLESEPRSSEKQNIENRLKDVKSEIDRIDKANHERDIPQAELEKLIEQQTVFEEKLFDSRVVKFVTSIGIDITSKEIQVGLNQDIVDSKNIDSIVSTLEGLMPKDAKWHVVYSDVAKPVSCTQKECTPIIGGNYIKVTGENACSFGFQAKKGSTWGWITAGHYANGKVRSSVKDYSNDNIGTVSQEKFYWGASCDCAWITASSTLTDNKIFGHGGQFTITGTIQASQQQNDVILKSGQAGGKDLGVVSATNVSVLDIGAGQYIKHLVRSSASMNHGDSGGTIVQYSDQGDLYGIASTHDWWGNYHVSIDQIEAYMGISAVLN